MSFAHLVVRIASKRTTASSHSWLVVFANMQSIVQKLVKKWIGR